LSEAFFESPLAVAQTYPAVYEQLTQFYRQDPAARLPRPESAARATASA